MWDSTFRSLFFWEPVKKQSWLEDNILKSHYLYIYANVFPFLLKVVFDVENDILRVKNAFAKQDEEGLFMWQDAAT